MTEPKSWAKPEVVEVKMDAEIGSYQLDDEDRSGGPDVTMDLGEEHTEAR